MTTVSVERNTTREPITVAGLTVAVVTGGIPHYRWPFFTELADRGAAVHLIAAGKLPPGILVTASPDSRVRLTVLPAGRPRWRRDVVAALRSIRPDVVLLEHGASLDYSWTTLLARRIGAPRVLWTHGIARQELYGGRHGAASWGRWTQLAVADAIVCYDAEMAGRMRRTFPRKPVGSAPNSTDGTAITAERGRCEQEGRDRVRRALGLSGRFYLAGLGRLVLEKDFARLLRVVAALRGEGLDLGVILIGGGPEDQSLRMQAHALGMRPGRDVIFTGALADAACVGRWLYAADACVSPGALGLSVVDCLFAGAPVVSFEPTESGPHHGPEWRYLEPGVTGFFAARPTDDALAAACREYLARTEHIRDAHRAACVAYAANNLGIGPMADGMLRLLQSVHAKMRGGSA